MISILQAVGNNAPNVNIDVQKVQRLINNNISRLIPFLNIKVDGDCGPVTTGMILEFQFRVMEAKKPDGRIDPGRKTLEALNEYASQTKKPSSPLAFDNSLLKVQQYLKTAPSPAIDEKKTVNLTGADYRRAAMLLGTDVASIRAVASVESSGSGFLTNGNPKVLFEGHQFSRRTKRAYDKSHPTISYKAWTKKYYKKNGTEEYSRYNTAKALDSDNAMKSTSWGKFQIMGFNHAAAGYATVQEFVKAMHESEGKQLIAFVNFLKSEKFDVHLKSKSWAAFAKGYNGPAYAKNKYDVRLKQAYKAFSADGK